MMLARDGLKIVLTAFILSFVLLMGGFVFERVILTVLFWPVFIFFLFALWFFRDPERDIPAGEQQLLCPADGRVVEIAETEDEYVGPARRVSIFMSVFNVHVNRLPLSGTVESVTHHDGRFRAALNPVASFENERVVITLRKGPTRISLVQVAGLIARRIVCRLQPGEEVSAGERFGMIKFGSRVDLILPLEARITVSVGQRVRAGETLIGELP